MSYRILLVKDRRPGHFRKSEGVAAAVARRLDVAVEAVTVRERVPLPGSLQRRLALAHLPPVPLLRLFWGIRVETLQKPDLVVSAGAETLAPNLLLARHFGCPNVFAGSLRNVPADRVSAILHVDPKLATAPRHLITLSPSPVDPDRLDPPRPIASAADLPERVVALLVGGPAPGYCFADADWSAVERLVLRSAEAGLAWRITSSRRTPAPVADRFAALAARLPERVRFVDYRREKAGSIDALFNADAVLVTEDSNTMIAEAVAARRPVLVLRPSGAERRDASLEALAQEHRVAIVTMPDLDREQLVPALASVLPLEANPLDTLYERLQAGGIVPPQPGVPAG
jgi:mitochondrial fission protein ELM1